MAEEPDGNSEADRVRLGSHTTCLFPRRPQTLHPGIGHRKWLVGVHDLDAWQSGSLPLGEGVRIGRVENHTVVHAACSSGKPVAENLAKTIIKREKANQSGCHESWRNDLTPPVSSFNGATR